MSKHRKPARRHNPKGEMPLWPWVAAGTAAVVVVGVVLYRRMGQTNQAVQQATQTAAPIGQLANTANTVLDTAAGTANTMLGGGAPR